MEKIILNHQNVMANPISYYRNLFDKEKVNEVYYLINSQPVMNDELTTRRDDSIQTIRNMKNLLLSSNVYVNTILLDDVCSHEYVDLFLVGNKRYVKSNAVFVLNDIYENYQYSSILTAKRYEYIAERSGLDLKTVMKKLAYAQSWYRKFDIEEIMRYNIANQQIEQPQLVDMLAEVISIDI